MCGTLRKETMFINGVPGRHAFKALYNDQGAWLLTDSYFFDLTEVQKFFADRVPTHFLWPVEVVDGQIVYVPDRSEYE